MPRDMNDEINLIFLLKQGSHKAFNKIYRMYAKRLYAYCLQFTKSPEDAEEIVQDVFVKLWTNRTSIKQEETLKALLFVMTKRCVISAFRSKINQPAYEEYVNCNEVMRGGDAGRQLEYREWFEKFKKAVKELPVTQQKVIILSKIKELSNKEIARQLALSEQTVKNSLSAGLKKLKAKLTEMYFLFLLLIVNFVGLFGIL